jgi:hypothetical protein
MKLAGIGWACTCALTEDGIWCTSDKRLLKDKHYGSVDLSVFDHVNPLVPESDVTLDFDGGVGQADVHLSWSLPGSSAGGTLTLPDGPDSPASIKTSRSRFSTGRRSLSQNGD